VSTNVDQRPGSGWAAFVGVFLIVAGSLKLLWGIAA